MKVKITENVKMALMMTGFMVFVVVVMFLSVNERKSLDQAMIERFSSCTYLGTRIERTDKVYRYDCDGVQEETLRRLGK